MIQLKEGDFTTQIDSLKKATERLIEKYRQKIEAFSIDDFLESDVDPFRFGFNAKIWGIKNALRKEIEHKIEMSLEDLFGDFHENYLGNATHIPSGTTWRISPKGAIPGVDIVNEEKGWFLQIKSKHNSMNSSSAKRLAQELEELANEKPNSVVGCGWVIADPKRKCIGEGDIKKVANTYKGRAVYAFVTGNENEMDEVLSDFESVLADTIKGEDFSGLLDAAVDRILSELEKRANNRKMTKITEFLLEEAVGRKPKHVQRSLFSQC